MTTIVRGLHCCKPANTPKVGQVKKFVLIDNGDWTKIKNPDTRSGEIGVAYTIVSVEQTDYSDAHGNVSFNLDLEPAGGGVARQPGEAQPATRRHDPPPPEPSTQSDTARQHVMRACNLYNLCVDAVNICIAPNVP